MFFEYRPCGPTRRGEDLRVLLHAFRPRWVIGNGTFCETARLLADGNSCDQAARSLAARFDIAFERAVQDVRYVTDCLFSMGFFGETSTPPTHPRIPNLKTLQVYITGRCNLACPHCCTTNMPEGDLAPDSFRKMVDELVDLGGKNITLTGGEALLHLDLKELLAYGGRHCAMTVLTNGTLLDGEWARFLAGLGDVHIQVSLDGSRKEVHDAIRGKGTFERALRGIEHLHEAGLGGKLTLAATVMARNLFDLPGIVDLAARLGVPRLRFIPLRKKGRAEREWDVIGAPVDAGDYEKLFDLMLGRGNGNTPAVDVSCGLDGFVIALPEAFPTDDLWCPVGTQLVVTAQGDAYPCMLLEEKQFGLGNVFREGLARVTASEGMKRVCATLAERRRKIEECARCPWRNFCQGGCMGQAMSERGTVWEKGRFCAYRQRRYEESFMKLVNGAAARQGEERR